MEPVETYLPMVQVVIAKMRREGWPIRKSEVEDLAQEGAIALVEAYRSCDRNRPEPIEARLAKAVRQGIARAFLRERSAETGVSINELQQTLNARAKAHRCGKDIDLPRRRRIAYEELFTNSGEARF